MDWLNNLPETAQFLFYAGVKIICVFGPLMFLVAVSLTQFDLARPETWTDFSRPLGGYRRVLQDARFVNSLVVQAKLSIAPAEVC